MSIGILKFKLPEEQEEFQLAQDGGKYNSVLFELDNFLRSKLKYEELSEIENTIYQELRTELHRQLEDHGIGLFS